MQVSIRTPGRESVADYDIQGVRILRTTYGATAVLLGNDAQLTGSNSLSFQVWSNQG
jgi:hypothetical protein